MFSAKINNNYIQFIDPEFIHEDGRGLLAQISSNRKWSQVNYIKSDIGAIRGNHYHQLNRELFYVIDGRFTITLEKDNDKLIYDIVAGDMFIVEPFVRHSFEYLEKTMLITMYDKGVQLENGKMDIIT
jgi:quercetin dioxygenase-like cupin family protein